MSHRQTSEKSFSSFFIDKLKRLEWQDYVFIVLVAIMFFSQYSILSTLQQLPSPIYGGDYYNHLGSMYHIQQGGSVFENAQMNGEWPWVPWLYHVLVVGFSLITGLSLIKSVIFFSLILLIVGSVIMYLLMNRLFKNKIVSLIGLIIYFKGFPVFKYSPFAYYIIVPLFLLLFYNFFIDRNYKNAILAGIIYGLAGLSNTYTFIACSFFIMFFLIYIVLFENCKVKDSKLSVNKQGFKRSVVLSAVIFFIGLAIAMLFWYKPVFVYHAHTLNDMQIYGFMDSSTLGGMVKWITVTIHNYFFNYGNFAIGVFSTLTLIGLIVLFTLMKRSEMKTFLTIFIISSTFGLFSHFLTLPLMGTHFVPRGIWEVLFTTLAVLLSVLAIKSIADFFNNRWVKIAVYSIFAVIFVSMILSQNLNLDKDKWIQTGKQPLGPYFTEIQNWILANTGFYDTFLTTNEDGFALNALTGRKLVTNRRTHSSTYADLDQKMLDAGIMLYTDNDSLREELLRKYDVKYLFWGVRWLQNEFMLDDQGNIQGLFDPLMMKYSPEKEQALKDAHVNYTIRTEYLDPAWQEGLPRYKVIVILPKNMNVIHPWDYSLDPYLVPKKELSDGTNSYFKIYAIKESADYENMLNMSE